MVHARNKTRYYRSGRGAVELYVTGGKVEEEEHILQVKARSGKTSRGQTHVHYSSVKRRERKSGADGTAILKDEEKGAGSKESHPF
ncbi:hypothetical protein JG688_00014161 [Phytophthora aleatoria]|uniref:Uncharacterized protein n=1 Tax=Phytophthora aleatoria TaxID=2496075 RepID=A0A8J5ILE6_9STRA|nr:hypothetical protein JG688_00014161 [Phytophthora aleatoria]